MSEHEIHTIKGSSVETSSQESGQGSRGRERRGRPQARHHVKEACVAYTPGEVNDAACEVLFTAFSLLQEKWVLFIIFSLLQGPLGFNELSRRAHGVNTTTLTQRLMLLEEHGLVKRTVYSMMPPRTIYELTEAGRALREVINAIERWGEQYIQGIASCEPDEGS